MKKSAKCTACPYHAHSQTVCMAGQGSDRPTWLFVGEAPGRTEDGLGYPFCGETGVNLRLDLHDRFDFPEDACRFTNAVRCWPGEGNPTPSVSIINTCNHWLKEEIERYKPRVVILLGNSALRAFGRKEGVKKLRGTAWEEDGIYYVATYHPSYVYLYNSADKLIQGYWAEDMEMAKALPEKGLPTPETPPDWLTLTNFDDAMDLLKAMRDVETSISFDIETHGEVYSDDRRLLTVAYCWEPGMGFCIPLMKSDGPWGYDKALDLMEEIARLHVHRRQNKLYMEAYSCVMEIKFPQSLGIPPPLFDFDPYLAHHLLDEEMSKPGLKQLAWFYTSLGGYDRELDEYISTHPEADPNKGGSYDNIPLSILGPYNAADADVSKRIRLVLEPKLKEEELEYVLTTITLPASHVMAEYEANGLYIDQKYLDKLMLEYPTKMADLQRRARRLKDVRTYERLKLEDMKARADALYEERMARYKQRLKEGKRTSYPRRPKPPEFTFNLGSGPQCVDIIYGVRKDIPVVAYTDKNQPSLNADAKEVLRNAHPLIPLMDEHGSLSKFFGTYIKEFYSNRDSRGIYHGYYNLAGTVTGRLSSNLQQIPRSSTNEDIRRMLSSRFGDRGRMGEVDVSQGEMRIMCIASKDKALRRIYRAGLDAHTMAAAWEEGIVPVGQIPPAGTVIEVDQERRSRIKSGVSFGLIYGRQAPGLARDFGKSKEWAEEFINNYFTLFAGVKKQIKTYVESARTYGYVRNLLGRRRRLGNIHSNNPEVRSHAERQAVNAPIQSTLHDLMLFAQVQMLEMFREYRLESVLCGEAHDSVIVDYVIDEEEIVQTILLGCLENLGAFFKWIDIPIVADMKVGPNLCDLTKVERG